MEKYPSIPASLQAAAPSVRAPARAMVFAPCFLPSRQRRQAFSHGGLPVKTAFCGNHKIGAFDGRFQSDGFKNQIRAGF